MFKVSSYIFRISTFPSCAVCDHRHDFSQTRTKLQHISTLIHSVHHLTYQVLIFLCFFPPSPLPFIFTCFFFLCFFSFPDKCEHTLLYGMPRKNKIANKMGMETERRQQKKIYCTRRTREKSFDRKRSGAS